MAAGDESAKRVELLKHAVPAISRVAVLWTQSIAPYLAQTATAARALGADVASLELRGPDDLDHVLAQAAGSGSDSLNVLSSASVVPLTKPIVEFAAKAGLPAMYGTTSFASSGGLVTYSPNVEENFRRAATFVDKILKGVRPGDLSVERPFQYDFVINLKTAEALGITISDEVLVQATRIIR
jgi:putative ABC transport system substrate-binding protein